MLHPCMCFAYLFIALHFLAVHVLYLRNRVWMDDVTHMQNMKRSHTYSKPSNLETDTPQLMLLALKSYTLIKLYSVLANKHCLLQRYCR